MPTLFYIYLSVFLIIFLSHLIKFKVIIKYDQVLLITFKLLFFKYTIKPIKEEIDLAYVFSFDGFLSELDDIRDVLKFIFSKNNQVHKAYKEFISHLSYKLVYLNVKIYTENATKTALVYSHTISVISGIVEFLRSVSVLKIPKNAIIKINPSFLPSQPYLSFIISSQISLASLVYLWLKIGIRLLLSLISSSKSTRATAHYGGKYGTKQAK